MATFRNLLIYTRISVLCKIGELEDQGSVTVAMLAVRVGRAALSRELFDTLQRRLSHSESQFYGSPELGGPRPGPCMDWMVSWWLTRSDLLQHSGRSILLCTNKLTQKLKFHRIIATITICIAKAWRSRTKINPID